MITQIPTQAVHHLTLTVTDLQRSCDFYTSLLGFQLVRQISPTRVLLSNSKTGLALTLPPDPAKAIRDDAFNENRIGLDHLSFAVENRAVIDDAVALFKEKGIPYGEIEEMGTICMVAFRDPDNIQLELTAPANP